MDKLLDRLTPKAPIPEAPPPGIYSTAFPPEAERPTRLHLRLEADGRGILIVNAATVLHLNPTAAEHVYWMIRGLDSAEAARTIAGRYRVSRRRALRDQRDLRARILRLAEAPDLDPVLFLGMERLEPYGSRSSAPYRLDCALTYRIGESGEQDPLARERVDRELSEAEWKQILEKAWTAGIPHVTFTGGEPTLRPDLPGLIRHAEELGQVTGLLTNARQLADASYFQALDQAGLDHLLVALIPGDPLSESGLKQALESELFTAVHLNLTPLGEEEAVDWIHRLSRLGVPAISLSVAVADEEGQRLLQEARDLVAKLGMDLIWDLPAPYSENNPIAVELSESPKGAGSAWLYVEPDGDVLPSQGTAPVLGNLLIDPWQAIWDRAASPADPETA